MAYAWHRNSLVLTGLASVAMMLEGDWDGEKVEICGRSSNEKNDQEVEL